VLSVVSIFVGLILPSHYREQTGKSFFPFIIVPVLISALLWYLLNRYTEREQWNLSNVNDLVQGSVEAPVGELAAAFKHFKGMEGGKIEVVAIHDHLKDL